MAASLEIFTTVMPAAVARGGGQRAKERLGQSKGAEQVGGERALQVFALGVGQ